MTIKQTAQITAPSQDVRSDTRAFAQLIQFLIISILDSPKEISFFLSVI
tara:strand:- start:706 stop:852 length:147 start_codon:yes stop_codon:yes gene_type:complete